MSIQSPIQSIVPIVSTKLMRETRKFYVDLLGMQVSFDHEHYLGLRTGAEGSPEIGFMLPDADAPSLYQGGLTFGFRVGDADRECARLKKLGVAILREPKDEPWGARAFILRDPNGVTLYVSHPIPAALEFQSAVK
jgi:catechol 2,3-dioxygenase-like lactoylglutathione lyase family enzyme